jgi:phage shock protein C
MGTAMAGAAETDRYLPGEAYHGRMVISDIAVSGKRENNVSIRSEAIMNGKKLYLSTTDKKLSGVCGGIAEYFSMDATAVRLLWVILTILSGVVPGVVAYIVAAAIVPHSPETESPMQSSQGSAAHGAS